ncbi:MAG: NAD(P)/FAD-dependent oxidoreductase [Euryarchaeota archaeon TMED248]|nr:MAG: NAD(P)/FAD-dependent oxidoreductase [Euryarchaeota archaeon TMED248]
MNRINQWFDASKLFASIMARVLIVGAGLAGLSAAIDASANGHHVVVVERSEKVGGRGTSQNKENFSLTYGPHLFEKKGPLWQLCRRLSRRKFSSKPLRLDKVEVLGHGMIRPRGNVSRVIENKTAIRQGDLENKIVQGASFLSSWDSKNQTRNKALLKSRLLVSNEGWIGLVGRLAAALDEIGVLIECGLEVESVHDYGVKLKDGKRIEADVVILACGINKAKQFISKLDNKRSEEVFSKSKLISASIIEVGLDSKPLRGRQAIIDTNNDTAIIDYISIQPRLSASGSHLSAISVGGLKGEGEIIKYSSKQERMENLEKFLDSQASGWRKHIVTQLRQEKITIHESPNNRIDGFIFSDLGIILAGSWVENDYILSDAAVHSGRTAGKNISKAIR